MLLQLRIKNFAIVDEAELDFSSGLNIITGETGAGKSILIRALTTLSGARVSLDLIRKGAEQAWVSGVFEVSQDHPVVAQLEELGIEDGHSDGDKKQIILRRVLSNKGRSVCYINDCVASSQSLIKISAYLLDIFGQHENQRLLDAGEHYRYLDLFLTDRKAFENYRKAFELVAATQQQIRIFQKENQVRQRDRDYLQFRLNELNELNPNETEFQELEGNIARQSKVQDWRSAFSRSREAVDEGFQGDSLARAFDVIVKELSTATEASSSVPEMIDNATNLRNLAEELSFQINQANDRLEGEDDLANFQERLDNYYSLMHKMSCRTADELMVAWKRLQEDVELADGAEQHLQGLLKTLNTQIQALEKSAKSLTAERLKAAEKIQKLVQSELADLGIPDARFIAEFTSYSAEQRSDNDTSESSAELSRLSEKIRSFRPHGPQAVQFLLGANRGEACLPLEKAASGGEISRIMLAIKKAMAVDAGTCVMVFDEIDTGISGRIADRVGRKLSELSKLFQVLCISHLPQVAVYADVNMSVRKSAGAQRTTSQIVRLSKSSEVVDEIANLLSGPELSASSRKNAKDLIAKATENKSQI